MSLSAKSVLVTGGAGFIGSHLVDRIIAENPARVTVVDNFFLGSDANLRDARAAFPDLEVVRLDASDLASMQDIVRQRSVDTLFDLAVIPLPTSLTYPAWTVQVNVGIATTVCELARREEIGRLLHVSSSEAYGSARHIPMDEDHPHDAITPYAASKSAADRIIESYVQTFNIDATVVRPFNNIGPRQNPGSYAGIVPIVIQRVLAGEPITIFGDGEQTRDFIFAPDTADLIVAVHDTPECRGQLLNVATGRETSVNEMVRRLLEHLGAPDHPIVHGADRPGDVRRHLADVTKMRTLLNRESPRLTDDALAQTVDWYRSELS
ncbi:NAD-dependent epimerase/dehydratase family protein [Microbacterium sp. M28]|uniref:dTDP-glucose 4,6-dehydratase n=1 Tax=Microbacterium sp. M28 TaxID=2962064 RepID=UPI0021F4347D|nr:NAD-dependent epimerase/dehydratase family protein [Microbacterium sp. M28]UYO98162.1 NAD-dependent epimerase/dehydratase family protein [Microbacterium sp. M28]